MEGEGGSFLAAGDHGATRGLLLKGWNHGPCLNLRMPNPGQLRLVGASIIGAHRKGASAKSPE